MDDFKPSTRQAAILNMVRESGFVATEAMVVKFDVTPQTVRRDLNELSEHGLLERFHGGAGQAKSIANRPYLARQQTGVEAKRQIARAAAALVPSGASLFLNIGTTTEAVAAALLEHQDLHVVTNNIHVAQILSRNDSFQIMLSGGQVRNHDGGIIGTDTTDFMDKFRLDVGIIGISGIDEDGALLDFDLLEVRTAQAIIRNSKKVILVADQHKFGRRAMNRLAHLGDLDVLVTDAVLSDHYTKICQDVGIEVIVVPEESSA